MSQPQSEIDLAHYVARRAHLSMHLISGVRGALQDLDRPDLAQVLALVERHASEAHAACKAHIGSEKQARRLRILHGLGRLTRLGGSKALRVAREVAMDLAEKSGAHDAYRA